MKAFSAYICTAFAACAGIASAESLSKGAVYMYVNNCTNVYGGSDIYFYTEIDESATKSAQSRKTGYGKIVSGEKKSGPNVMKFEGPLLTWETVATPSNLNAEMYIYDADVTIDDKLGKNKFALRPIPANCRPSTQDLLFDEKKQTRCSISFAICPVGSKPKELTT